MKSFLAIFLSFFVSISVFAATDITHLRNDLTIPEHCQSNDISDFFSDDLKYITYSRTGGVRSGFDYEYDISRESLRKFWSIFKGSPGGTLPDWVKGSEKLKRDYQLILENYIEMDFDFSEEGQVLEILALLKIKEELDLSKYYITGSVAYSGGKTQNRIGELDIVIGDVETCKVSVVGEVKINPRRLGKARGQLSRFRRFIKSIK